MKLLLDTHVLVWLAEGLEELPEAARGNIDRAAAAGLAVSAISFWEIAMLEQRGRLSLSSTLVQWRARILSAPAFAEAPVTGEIGVEAVRLPGSLHADPADRLIVATARVHGFKLATRDRRLLEYAANGHVKALSV